MLYSYDPKSSWTRWPTQFSNSDAEQRCSHRVFIQSGCNNLQCANQTETQSMWIIGGLSLGGHPTTVDDIWLFTPCVRTTRATPVYPAVLLDAFSHRRGCRCWCRTTPVQWATSANLACRHRLSTKHAYASFRPHQLPRPRSHPLHHCHRHRHRPLVCRRRHRL